MSMKPSMTSPDANDDCPKITLGIFSYPVQPIAFREVSKILPLLTRTMPKLGGRQFEEDVAAGRLDRLAEEALRDLREGRCTDL